MPLITAVKPQKYRKGVNIYLDGRYAFALDLENFVKFGLKVGQELPEERISQITRKGEYQKILDRALIFATIRPRSEKEINDWMVRKKVDEDLKIKLKDKLFGLDLINEEKFAKWWVEQRLQFKFKSKRELIFELKGKGIKKEIVEKVLSCSEINEEQAVKELIEKRIYKWKGLGKLERRQKISRYLAGKGYTWDIVKSILENEKI